MPDSAKQWYAKALVAKPLDPMNYYELGIVRPPKRFRQGASLFRRIASAGSQRPGGEGAGEVGGNEKSDTSKKEVIWKFGVRQMSPSTEHGIFI
jgi:hypothetical protein